MSGNQQQRPEAERAMAEWELNALDRKRATPPSNTDIMNKLNELSWKIDRLVKLVTNRELWP